MVTRIFLLILIIVALVLVRVMFGVGQQYQQNHQVIEEQATDQMLIEKLQIELEQRDQIIQTLQLRMEVNDDNLTRCWFALSNRTAVEQGLK